MGAWIELKPEGADTISAWRADPAGKPRGGIVVVQEIFGVNAHIRAMADRFAAEGYLAVAPAIFDHVERGFDVGYDPQARTRGMATASKADFEQILRDVAAAIEVAREGGKVGIVGYCLGGSVAWAAAGRLSGLSAAVGYYGGRVIAMKDLKPRIPTMLHFGDKDANIPIAGVREVGRRSPRRPDPHLPRRTRFQLRSARELRRAERRAGVDADFGVLRKKSGVIRISGFFDSRRLKIGKDRAFDAAYSATGRAHPPPFRA